jgi:hypothetical protein
MRLPLRDPSQKAKQQNPQAIGHLECDEGMKEMEMVTDRHPRAINSTPSSFESSIKKTKTWAFIGLKTEDNSQRFRATDKREALKALIKSKTFQNIWESSLISTSSSLVSFQQFQEVSSPFSSKPSIPNTITIPLCSHSIPNNFPFHKNSFAQSFRKANDEAENINSVYKRIKTFPLNLSPPPGVFSVFHGQNQHVVES